MSDRVNDEFHFRIDLMMLLPPEVDRVSQAYENEAYKMQCLIQEEINRMNKTFGDKEAKLILMLKQKEG